VEGKEKFEKALDIYLKNCQEIGERTQKVFGPLRKQQEQLQKAIQTLVKLQNPLQKSLALIHSYEERRRVNFNSSELLKFALPDLGPVTKLAEELGRTIERFSINPFFKGLQRSFEELPPQTKESLILLGKHGWYLDLEMPISYLFELRITIEKGDVIEAEKILVKNFEKRLDEIEEFIVNRFPSRKKLINAAFKAHRHQEFELSIPVLLAQSDGICKEVINKYFFMKQNQKPQTAIYVEHFVSNAYQKALLTPFTCTLPINMSKGERNEDFNDFNRHMVLHGESLDYGTKNNSLKAISLINYVTQVLKIECNEH
jgi:hypothetical protein